MRRSRAGRVRGGALFVPCRAWREAERYGCDMSLVAHNLALTIAERILQHARARETARILRAGLERSRARR